MNNYDHDSETSANEARPRPRRQRRKQRAPANNHDYLSRPYDDEDGTISNPIALANQISLSQSKTSVEYLSKDSSAPPAYPGSSSRIDRRSEHANRRLTKMSNTSEEVENNGNDRRRPRRKVKSTQRLPRSVSEEVLAVESRESQASKPPNISEEGRSQQARSTDRLKGDRDRIDESNPRRPRKTRPREQPKKKKPKANTYSSDNEENYQGDEEFSEIFPVDIEDIIQPSSELSAKVNATKVSNTTAHTALPTSQPSNIVYIEKKGGQGFVSEHKSKLNKPTERTIQLRDVDKSNTSRLDFIYSIHLGFHRLAMIAQGLIAGIALSQCIFVYSLSKEKVTTLLEQYEELALPYQSLYYFLLAICVVSIFDRYIDISSGWSQFFSILISNPSRAIALVSYLFAFIFSISLAQLDDRISLHRLLPDLWKKDVSKRIATWKIINLLRVIGSVLGWIMVALSPDDDITAAAIKKNIDKEKCEKVYNLNTTHAKIKPI